MIEVKPATGSDVVHIMKNLSSVNRRELEELDKSIPDFTNYVLEQIKASPCQVGYVDGKPAVMLGVDVDKSNPSMGFTWFIATDKYFSLGLEGIRFGRAYMKELAASNPEMSIFSISGSPHSGMSKWFKLLGASFVHKEGPLTVFSF